MAADDHPALPDAAVPGDAIAVPAPTEQPPPQKEGQAAVEESGSAPHEHPPAPGPISEPQHTEDHVPTAASTEDQPIADVDDEGEIADENLDDDTESLPALSEFSTGLSVRF